jgi:hypothetical protein
MSPRVQQIAFRGAVESRDTATPLLSRGGDTVLVKRGKPRMLIMRCPCGCGDDLLINLDRQVGPAWRYYNNRHGLTLYPSYWRNDGCGSHFIIWNNHIYWCYGRETQYSNDWFVPTALEDTVFARLPEDRFVSYEEIAEQLELIPWEVLQACHQLVKRGKAISDKWPRNNHYRRNRELIQQYRALP